MADLSITAASVTLTSGSTQSGTAGASITAGQALYVDTSDSNKLKLADANDTAAKAVVAGIALHAAASGQPIKYATADAVINPGATCTVGEIYVVSTTAGGIAPVADYTTGQYLGLIGYATAAGALKLICQTSGVARG